MYGRFRLGSLSIKSLELRIEAERKKSAPANRRCSSRSASRSVEWKFPPPIELRVPAQRVRNWKLINTQTTTYEEVDLERYRKNDVIELVTHKLKGHFRFTPPLPPPSRIGNRLSRKIETISLVPYGCTNLRMTIFPWHNHF